MAATRAPNSESTPRASYLQLAVKEGKQPGGNLGAESHGDSSSDQLRGLRFLDLSEARFRFYRCRPSLVNASLKRKLYLDSSFSRFRRYHSSLSC